MRRELVRQGRRVKLDGGGSANHDYHIIGWVEELVIGCGHGGVVEFVHVMAPDGRVTPVLLEQVLLPLDDPEYESAYGN